MKRRHPKMGLEGQEKKTRQLLLKKLATIIRNSSSPKSPAYKTLSAKGVEVCQEWQDNEESFISWAISSGFEIGLAIHRRNLSESYTPENCYWDEGARKSDLTGQVFGRLTAVKRTATKKEGNFVWECLCECGSVCYIKSGNLAAGITKSCGCLTADSIACVGFTDGRSSHPLYVRYQGMISRCYNPNGFSYKNYGGRGITVCDEWRNDPEAFYEWAVHNGCRPGLHLDRIDNDGPYSPENCRYITNQENQQNKRSSRFLNHRGTQINVSQFAKDYNLKFAFVYYQAVHKGRSGEEIIQYAISRGLIK